MSAIKGHENRTESALRKALHRMGLRYRKYAKGLPGRPDIIFPKQKVAVFVDGDYWHARLLRENGLQALEAKLRTPTRGYWLAKFQRRVCFDDEVSARLEGLGWKVIRLWESDIVHDIEGAARQVAITVRRRRRS